MASVRRARALPSRGWATDGTAVRSERSAGAIDMVTTCSLPGCGWACRGLQQDDLLPRVAWSGPHGQPENELHPSGGVAHQRLSRVLAEDLPVLRGEPAGVEEAEAGSGIADAGHRPLAQGLVDQVEADASQVGVGGAV